ncbi:hypothetical protein E8E12_003478 [Didymella heteroderae]|uniref:DUF676 domain-containing protein n=1 Tax=Didymella heteroderae TaxID=1769908 RepID=A0A9P4WHR4_9PLEO|nr:hypothetical protein E8E12_003478 [Didymella heteroderae]
MSNEITDEFAVIREDYAAPKYTIVLAHGLLGFSELRLAGQFLPGLKYWRGITEALSAKGIEVIVATVPPSGSVEARATKLVESIAAKARGKEVNIIAHSMGGLDSRYMISQLKPTDFKIKSLTTIATPHRGSSFADYMFETIGPRRVKRIYNVIEYFGFETGAFSQLTLKYMRESFNPRTPDIEDVRYFSYGASLEPERWSVFAPSHAIVKREEGINDGLVSVTSSQWGDYKGTLIGVSHLDLINWTNRMKWWFWSLTGKKRNFNAIALYLDICDKQRPVLEVHKVLYKTQVVWPANMTQDDLLTNNKTGFTMQAGNFEYPFQFKIPLNTSCHAQQATAPLSNISFANTIPEFAKTPTQHIKSTLPPSLTGFPGEAEIRYFVKVTVNRPSLFKENPRAIANFTMLPIEPPRPERQDGEAYARRQHQFLENAPSVAAGKKPGLFDRKSSTSVPTSPTSSGPPPRVSLDARLPNPAILTANQDMPLRVLMKNMSPRTKNVYLQMLQIELIGYTKVRAHEVARTESNSWILCSFSNMAIPLGAPTDAVETEVPINPEYWSDKPIPNTVPPTFQTCNLSRFYELEVRVGIGYGSYKQGEDQLVVLPLRLPVKVYSGIAPPKALLESALTGEAGKTANLGVPPPAQGPHMPSMPTHTGFGGPSTSPNATHRPQSESFEAPPPTYEEAVGQDLPPINGYRGTYQPPPVPEGAPRFSDEKRR